MVTESPIPQSPDEVEGEAGEGRRSHRKKRKRRNRPGGAADLHGKQFLRPRVHMLRRPAGAVWLEITVSGASLGSLRSPRSSPATLRWPYRAFRSAVL